MVISGAPQAAMAVANYGKQWPWIASSCHFERMADENDFCGCGFTSETNGKRQQWRWRW